MCTICLQNLWLLDYINTHTHTLAVYCKVEHTNNTITITYPHPIVGKQPKVVTPLQNLRINELRQELTARDLKPELQCYLQQILRGVQHA